MNEEMIAAYLKEDRVLKVNKHPYKPRTYTEAPKEKSTKKPLKKEESRE